MAENNNILGSSGLSNRRPYAMASIGGNTEFPDVTGTVRFYTAPGGTIVDATLNGLPPVSQPTANPRIGPFGFHVHEGAACTPTDGTSPFSDASGHYNPTDEPHPLHAGDLPVIFPNNGFGYLRTYTDRFTPSDVVGRTVILHEMPDDFRTQPAGDSGMRMACGPIQRYSSSSTSGM